MVSPEEDLATFYDAGSSLLSAGEKAHVPDTTEVTDPAAARSVSTSSAEPVATPDALPGLAARKTVLPSPTPPEFATDEEMPPQLARVARPMPVFTEPKEEVHGAPHPVLALGMSLILPGVGQMYAGQILKGSAILGVSILTCMGGGIFNLLAAADAFLVAKRVGRGETLTDWQSF